MEQPSVIHNTFVIERSYPKPPERVFSAFADIVQRRGWFAPGDHHDVLEFLMDFRVGGEDRLLYRFNESSPFPGVLMTNEGIYQDIVPQQRIVTAYTMSMGDKRISASLVTIELLPTESGTDLICTHQGAFFEGSDGPQIREAGWRELLRRLDNQLDRS